MQLHDEDIVNPLIHTFGIFSCLFVKNDSEDIEKDAPG